MTEENEANEAALRLVIEAQATAQHDRNFKLHDFDGDPNYFHTWVTHVQMCKEATQWSDEATAQRAKLLLKGKAAIWLQNQTFAGTEGLDTWFPDEANGVRPANLRTAMEARFSTTTSPTDLATLRDTLKQKDNEDVNSFFDRVTAVQFEMDKHLPLTFRVNSKANYTIVHNLGVFQNFLCGLKTEIRAYVTMERATTTQTALVAALAFEQGNKSKKAKIASMASEPNPSNMVDTFTSQLAAMALNQMRGRGGTKRGRGGRGGATQTGEGNDLGYCPYCGYVGHEKPKCNIKKKDEANGIFLPRSEFFQPGRIGRGGGNRGRGGRGGPPPQGQVYEMGATSTSAGSTGWGAMPPTSAVQQLQMIQQQQQQQQHSQQQFQQPQLQQQQQFMQHHTPVFYNDEGAAAAMVEQGAFRFYPAGNAAANPNQGNR